MDVEEFRKHAHELVEWMADYFVNIENRPVRSNVSPGDIIGRLPLTPPGSGESFEEIFTDFRNIILPGITHWQHPSWHGYFAANNSFPSILAEMLTSTLGAQCMSWLTSPAATELEQRMMEWLADMYGLPQGYHGVIQDTASTATLCALLTAREKSTDFYVNSSGLYSIPEFKVYCSTEAHSSIEKAVKIAGFGAKSLTKVPVDRNYALISSELEKSIQNDIANGFKPLAIVAAFGTTGSTAVDPLMEIMEIALKYKIWVHVDAAWAGTALLLPENRHFSDCIGLADSIVINPHKWMFTNFDCSAYFVRDKDALIRTFEILPEYLKTPVDQRVNNYRDWGIQLGRRFRALKLWFVIRSFGVDGLQAKIRDHITWAKWFAQEIEKSEHFELLAPLPFAVVCFRFHPQNIDYETDLTKINKALLEKLNQSGKLFLSHTTLNGRFTLRFVVGQTNTEKRHVENAWQLIRQFAEQI